MNSDSTTRIPSQTRSFGPGTTVIYGYVVPSAPVLNRGHCYYSLPMQIGAIAPSTGAVAQNISAVAQNTSAVGQNALLKQNQLSENLGEPSDSTTPLSSSLSAGNHSPLDTPPSSGVNSPSRLSPDKQFTMEYQADILGTFVTRLVSKTAPESEVHEFLLGVKKQLEYAKKKIMEAVLLEVEMAN